MTKSKITIVTPSFNHSTYLEQTIDSVLSQNYPNLEYIIIDGGSTDGSLDIIKKYEKHLTYWVSERDDGMYDAINKGFEKSTGEIMGWINSDDFYYPHTFSVLNDVFDAFPPVSWVTGAGSIANEQGQIVSVERSQKWSKYLFQLGKFGYIQQESTFWRRSLWEKSGKMLDSSLQLAGDMELWNRFFQYELLYDLPIPLGAFRRRKSGNAAYSNFEKYTAECEQVISASNSKLTSEELKQLTKIKRHYFILRFLEKTKIFNHSAFKKYFIDPQMGYAPDIEFDRVTQKFTFVS